MWDMRISELDIEEAIERPFQRKAFPRPDLSVVTLFVDNHGDIRLTLHEKPGTLPLEETDE